MLKKTLLILTTIASLTIANLSQAATDDDGYRIVHTGQKIELTHMIYGFPNHDDLVAFQAMIENITPEKKDQFLSSHKYLRLDDCYVTIVGIEEPHRIQVSLVGASYWVDASQLPEEN